MKLNKTNKKITSLLFAALMITFVFVAFVISINEAGTSYNELRPVVPFDELSDDIKIILEERMSPRALELIKIGRPPNSEMINAGLRREKFIGDIYPVYHEHGAVYIFRGDGTVIFGDNDVNSVSGLKPGEISIMEVWSTEELERLFGKRSPPPEPDLSISPSSSSRVYAGIGTWPINNTYFGVRADVRFPQFVRTWNTSFNIYTTHFVFANGQWFESAVGQYGYAGGNHSWPNVVFWANWTTPQVVVHQMRRSAGDFKTAELRTQYTPIHGICRMQVIDKDLWHVPSYTRTISGYFQTPRYVTLVQEQITNSTTPAPWANFSNTRIWIDNGTRLVDWTPSSGQSWIIANPPMQFRWINQSTYDFDTRCL